MKHAYLRWNDPISLRISYRRNLFKNVVMSMPLYKYRLITLNVSCENRMLANTHCLEMRIACYIEKKIYRFLTETADTTRRRMRTRFTVRWNKIKTAVVHISFVNGVAVAVSSTYLLVCKGRHLYTNGVSIYYTYIDESKLN